MQKPVSTFLAAGIISISAAMIPAQVQADLNLRDIARDLDRNHDHDYKKSRRSDNRNDYKRDRRTRQEKHRYTYRKPKKTHSVKSPIIHHGHSHSYEIPSYRIRRHRDIVVIRPYGPLYSGYGFYFRDDDAYKWLAFTAIAVKLLDNLNEQQQREHEAAQIRATTAPIGETIYWEEGNASGHVTPIREGASSSGRYCREFQHEVTIGGKREQAYGTACRQSDGSWEVISTGQ